MTIACGNGTPSHQADDENLFLGVGESACHRIKHGNMISLTELRYSTPGLKGEEFSLWNHQNLGYI